MNIIIIMTLSFSIPAPPTNSDEHASTNNFLGLMEEVLNKSQIVLLYLHVCVDYDESQSY